MSRPIIFSSILLLTACTQPAAMVEMRGQNDYSQSGGRYAMATQMSAAPVAAVDSAPVTYAHATPVYNASRAQDEAVAQQAAAPASMPFGEPSAPLASNTNNNSSIGVSDLAPAAGKAETPVSTTPAATKPVELKKVEENVPTNQWTNKPRDAASFNGGKNDTKYIWPVTSHNVTTTFGNQGKGKASDGINISAAQGEPVWASADGEVIYADDKMKGYGNMVIVKHAGGKTTTYAHLARGAVDKYDRVKQGDIIGYVGTTGSAKKPQLYFSMRDGNKAVDPQKYLDRNVAGL